MGGGYFPTDKPKNKQNKASEKQKQRLPWMQGGGDHFPTEKPKTNQTNKANEKVQERKPSHPKEGGGEGRKILPKPSSHPAPSTLPRYWLNWAWNLEVS